MPEPIKIIFTDLDGTILPHNGAISAEDLETLHLLQESNIIRVIATGRTLYSLKSIITPDFPIDYAIFSSGSGIINWSNQTIIKYYSLSTKIIQEISSIFLKLGQSFFLYDPIPHNHYFQYYQADLILPDFQRYLAKYEQFSRIFTYQQLVQEATQFLIMFKSLKQFNYLYSLLEKLPIKMIRATSPLDHNTMWLEFFNPQVSKGNGAQFLCEKLGFDPCYSLSVGNDYNDLDLLNFTHYSYLVDNAPSELKSQYHTTATVNNSGFSQIVRKLVNCQ